MVTALCRVALGGPSRLVARQQRGDSLFVTAARRTLKTTTVRSQGQDDQGKSEGDKQKELVFQRGQERRAPVQQRSSDYALDTLNPNLSRMNQMFRAMENEMNALGRAFGMPSLFSPSLFTDLPALAAELPAEGARVLAVDIKDTGDALEITADVPGLSKDDIKVQVSPDRVLTISGERKSEHREGSEEAGTLRVERSFGSFLRRFRLPDNVDLERIKASTKDGVLRLTVPKTEQAKHKEIDVQVE